MQVERRRYFFAKKALLSDSVAHLTTCTFETSPLEVSTNPAFLKEGLNDAPCPIAAVDNAADMMELQKLGWALPSPGGKTEALEDSKPDADMEALKKFGWAPAGTEVKEAVS